MKFQVTGDWVGIIYADSFNDAQVMVEQKLRFNGFKEYNFSLRVESD
jgi:hypothetical protein